VQAIEQAGGTPLWLPPAADVAVFAPLWLWLDGVLLPGGVDVHPYAYGEDLHPRLGTVDPEADRLELWLAEEAMQRNLPILGVNRGMQVLNVALGGSLFQDLAAQLGTWLHRKVGQPRSAPAHPVNVMSGTCLADLMGTEPAMVNSWHHQGIKGLGQGVAIASMAPDEVIEAIAVPKHRFACAVQWAVEALALAGDERMQRVFAGFIEAARASGMERKTRLLHGRATLERWERQWVRDLVAYTQGRERLFGEESLGDLEALELRQTLPVLKGRVQAVTEALGLPDSTPSAGRL
jgi:putative glutamine amidotransferase